MDMISEDIANKFGNTTTFSVSDIMEYLRSKFPALHTDTLKWHVHELKRKGIIQHVSRGVYSLSSKNDYQADISRLMVNLYRSLSTAFPFAEHCIWNTSWFNEFTELQQFHNYTIIETEKETTEAFFHHLAAKHKQVFLEPSTEVFEQYISGNNDSIIVKALVSEAPIDTVNNIKIAPLEKLLVDCLSDKVLFAAQQDFIDDIFRNVFDKYNININKMKRYASRRNKREEIERLIQTFGK